LVGQAFRPGVAGAVAVIWLMLRVAMIPAASVRSHGFAFMDGWRVADCCAGSGAFGIECVSRGAAEAHLCEPGRVAVTTIRSNLALLGDPPEVRLHARGFERVLPTLSGLDLVFCDPPFPWFSDERELLVEMLQLAAAAVAPDGIVLIRGERGEELPEHTLVERERREYGRSWVAMLKAPDGGLKSADRAD